MKAQVYIMGSVNVCSSWIILTVGNYFMDTAIIRGLCFFMQQYVLKLEECLKLPNITINSTCLCLLLYIIIYIDKVRLNV